MGNFQKRLREYERPQDSVSGFASSKKDLDYWEDRAEKNSLNATRARGGAMSLPDTGGAVKNRSTSNPPRGFIADPYKEAKSDHNNIGSSYLKDVRRSTR